MWGVNSVYRNTLGWNKEQAEIVAKIDEICKRYNELPKYIQDAINEALENFDPSGGTDDHTRLTNRDAEDQHPQSAITGLVAALAAKYVLPTGGIPAADLANAVQTSLGKADTALQSVPDLSATYVTVAQEIADAGKVLGINSSGVVVPVSAGGGGGSSGTWRKLLDIDFAVDTQYQGVTGIKITEYNGQPFTCKAGLFLADGVVRATGTYMIVGQDITNNIQTLATTQTSPNSEHNYCMIFPVADGVFQIGNHGNQYWSGTSSSQLQSFKSGIDISNSLYYGVRNGTLGTTGKLQIWGLLE